MNSYFYSNFNYCSEVWMISHAKSINILQVLQKIELRFLYDDYHSLSEKILKKFGKVCMEVKRFRYFCIEIYKTINNIIPSIMKQIFQLRETNREVRNQYKLNQSIWLVILKKLQDIMGLNLGSLQFHVKTSKNLKKFKDIIKNWKHSTCSRRVSELNWIEGVILLVQDLLILYTT